MKLSVLANLYGAKTLDETLQILTGLGVHTVEIGAGGYPGKAHCDPEKLLADEAALAEWLALFKKYGMEISNLSVHGNPVHPDAEKAKKYHDDFCNAVLLAEKIGLDPAVMASPFISTIVDALSLLVYFLFAKAILKL